MPKKTDYAVVVTDQRFGAAIRVLPEWEQAKWPVCGTVVAVVKGTTRAKLSDLMKSAAGFALSYMADNIEYAGDKAEWAAVPGAEDIFSKS